MRLATFNILHGRSPVDDRVDLDRFASGVAALDADVLGLQEVDRDQPRSHGADLTAVAAEAMGAPHHRFAATLAGTPDLWSAATGDMQPRTALYGIALLSRLPVLSWHALALPALRGAVPVVFPGRRRPTLVRDEPRAAVAAVIDAPPGPVTVVATHLTFIPGWNAVQLRRLVRLVRDLPRPVVLMGDLNLVGASPARISGMRPLATAPTFPVAKPVRQLDHILGDGPLTPVRGDAVDVGLSDHRALVAEVRVGPADADGQDVTGRPRARG
ncbi:endonuclease/exonuclease/phosphatase family protein [Cellulomonas sp. ATA003]|uniref:endonuclease/exonuclease/phosphatase family protein n=1 Tax=Cellulomonas sp. ATA003 TaxID=3073064 RepID=UPI002873AFCF|nr:endonuclease/exonuclease/phosphatase family protein [Cellulomonas sp. ATA003]WNB85333.1 endonuclease/exonuclease/phosphatase family protein [Cellulomonas sp. ATA003]